MAASGLETRINAKIGELAGAIAALRFPLGSLPEWVKKEFSEDTVVSFATAMSAFFDEGV